MRPLIVAILPARLSSSRLPGKVLMALGDRPVLKWVVDRVALSKRIDKIVVATTTNPADDGIADFCEENNLHCFRGSEDDVLGRFVSAAEAVGASLAVRVNPDNPLIDSHYLDTLIDEAISSGNGYYSFKTSGGLPVMLCGVSFFAEAIDINTLKRADQLITDPFEREHVTLGIYNRPNVFNVNFLPVPSFCNNSDIRLTVDTRDDFDLIGKLVSRLGERAVVSGAEKIVELIYQQPDLLELMKKQNLQNPKKASSREE